MSGWLLGGQATRASFFRRLRAKGRGADCSMGVEMGVGSAVDSRPRSVVVGEWQRGGGDVEDSSFTVDGGSGWGRWGGTGAVTTRIGWRRTRLMTVQREGCCSAGAWYFFSGVRSRKCGRAGGIYNCVDEGTERR